MGQEGLSGHLVLITCNHYICNLGLKENLRVEQPYKDCKQSFLASDIIRALSLPRQIFCFMRSADS